MATEYNHGPLFDGGAPRDMSLAAYEPGITSVETTQRFAYGTRYMTWDGRVFKYSNSGMANLGLDNLNWAYNHQMVSYAHIARSYTAANGVTEFIIDVGASDGESSNGVLALDELRHGYCVIFPSESDDHSQTTMVLTNTATVAAGESTITISEPISSDLTIDASHIEIMQNPYADVRTGNSGGGHPFMGLAHVQAVSGSKFWNQTYGPCWVSPQGRVGSDGFNMLVVVRPDGSLDTIDGEAQYTTNAQIIGYVLCWTSTSTQAAPMVMLQISI